MVIVEGLFFWLCFVEFVELWLVFMYGWLLVDDKDVVMVVFWVGEVDVLVCIMVIEVGVDVFNVMVMLVMDVDWFGIS